MTPTTPQAWQSQLPRINVNRRGETDKMRVLARFKHQATNTYFYVLQGDSCKNFWLYWGFAVVSGRQFPIQVTVSSHDLESGVWLGGVPCEVDTSFQSGQWVEFKNLHFPPSGPLAGGRMNDRGSGKLTHPHVLQ